MVAICLQSVFIFEFHTFSNNSFKTNQNNLLFEERKNIECVSNFIVKISFWAFIDSYILDTRTHRECYFQNIAYKGWEIISCHYDKRRASGILQVRNPNFSTCLHCSPCSTFPFFNSVTLCLFLDTRVRWSFSTATYWCTAQSDMPLGKIQLLSINVLRFGC